MFSYTKIMQALSSAVTTATDAYFNLVTLLLPGNGTNGAQNNTFLDSSSNNFTITRNGNTTQGTFSPFSQTGWSNYFDGTGDYLSVANNAAFQLGSGNWTIECWVYLTATSTTNGIYAKRSNAGYGDICILIDGGSLKITGSTSGSSWAFTDSVIATGISINAWTHIAIVRNSTSITGYVNGTAGGTPQSVSGSLYDSGQASTIGSSNAGASQLINGYISNFRFNKGTAVYTSNFTPSITPLTAISGTSLLTCQSNNFIDNSGNAFAITRNGDTSVQAFSPFLPTAAYSAATNGGSGYFDGTGDYLTVANNTALQVGSGDFTIEGWYYPTNSPAQADIFTKYSAGSQEWGVVDSSSSLGFYAGTGGASWTLSPLTFGTVKVNQWNHFAVCRSGNTFSTFLNGTRGATTTNSFTIGATTISVGIGSGNGFSGSFVNGYLSNYRIVKGTAVYDVSQTSITVPTAPFTNITNTSLLCNFTNAGITDATAKNDLETVGNAQISTTQSKFGGSSMYFDGSTSYLTKPYSPLLALGSGNFTIECWINTTQNASGNYPSVVGRWSGGNSWDLRHSAGDNSNKPTFAYNDGSSNFNVASTGSTIYDGAWHHLAAVRNGNTITLYVDGTSVGTSTFTGTIAAATSTPLTVGNNSGGSLYYTGYIDDLRITIGYARYTANFTPTTAAFPLS